MIPFKHIRTDCACLSEHCCVLNWIDSLTLLKTLMDRHTEHTVCEQALVQQREDGRVYSAS